MVRNPQDLQRICKSGRDIMSRSSVTICGLARDCAANLQRLIPQLESLAGSFADGRFIIVENDSRDPTGEIAQDWRDRNRNVCLTRFSYLGERKAPRGSPEIAAKAESGWFGQDRISRIAFARNLYLEALESDALPDYVIVIDLDIRYFSPAGIAHSFGLCEQWDIVTANGQRYSRRQPFRPSVYWDTYAYEPSGGFAEDRQTPDQIRSCQLAVSKAQDGQRLLPARSAFGGLGIYRAAQLAGRRYEALPNDHAEIPVLCEHHALHRSMRERHQGLRLMINPILRVGYGTPWQLAMHSIRSTLGR